MEMDYEKEYAQNKALKAMDKQIPLKPVMDHCECGMALDKGWKYCPDCGQRIDWRGTE